MRELPPSASPMRRETHDRVLRGARRVFEERGFAGVTMEDIALETRCSRSTVYRLERDLVDLLLAVAEATLRPAAPSALDLVLREPRRDHSWPAANWIAHCHAHHSRLELTVRGLAATGVPRATAFVARLDLRRHGEAIGLLTALTGQPPDERVHLLEQVLLPSWYRHLVGRCSWSHEQYVCWLARELQHLRRPSTFC